MLSRNRLIQRIRSARGQRRLFTGERGAIAASLVEIGVAMLAVGILTAGALTTFTGFIGRVSDTAARNTLSDAVTVADSVYNWLRTGGERCYNDTDCTGFTVANMVDALQEEAGGEITFKAYADGDLANSANTGDVLVDVGELAASQAVGTGGYLPAGSSKHYIRLAIRSDSGASFCVLKITKADSSDAEGVGYMSVNQTDTNASTGKRAAHCGAQSGHATAANRAADSVKLCIYGPSGAYSANTAAGVGAVRTSGCATTASPTKPGDSDLVAANWG